MTSAYLESATSSRSSIGGSVMPSGWATVPGISKPHNRWIRSNNSYYLFRGDSISLGSCAAVARATLGACAHQVYELVGGALDIVVDDRVVEFVLGGEFDLRGFQPAAAFFRGFRAPAHEAPFEFLPGGRGEEHQAGLRHDVAHLPGALQVDLQDDVHPLFEQLLHRPAQGAVVVAAMHFCVFEELALGDEVGELLGAEEVVLDTFKLTGGGRACRCRYREDYIWVPLAQDRRDGSYPDGGGSG